MRYTSLVCLLITFFCCTSIPGVEAGPFSWLKSLVPRQPSPEDPHLYPQEKMLFDIWTCKGETPEGWIGVTDRFTDQDPYIIVGIRSEFHEQAGLDHHVGMELQAPRHNRIVASDRVRLTRQQDVGFFYDPLQLARLGGWGEYRAVLLLDGVPKEEITFVLERQADLVARQAQREQDQLAEQALIKQTLKARELLGSPDQAPDDGPLVMAEDDAMKLPAGDQPQVEVSEPAAFERMPESIKEERIILFPKRPRKSWRENVAEDLRYRIQYYIFM